MGALNTRLGILYVKMSPNYFVQDDVINFIEELIKINQSAEKVCLFWDNASVHVGKDTKKFIASKKLNVI